MQLVRNDVTSQLQPRHSCRRERHPGARERHSTMKRRLCSDVDSQPSNTRLMTSQVRSSYCMTSASQYQRIGQSEVEVVTENSNVISAMKDLSTIEAIRESMRSTEKQQPFSEIKHRSIPTWMLGLDLNLDVTAVDIIPPFEQTSNSDEVTYDEQPTVTFINDDEEDIDLHDNYLELFPNEMETEYGRTIKSPEAVQAAGNTRTISISPTVSNRPPSSSPDGRGSRGTPRSQSRSSPRRYQGDKKVLSMQQGGIRSTPMQPTSTKFINQMITFTNVKVHDKKLKKAKPAIDTKMPSTFKIALERNLWRSVLTEHLTKVINLQPQGDDLQSSRTSINHQRGKRHDDGDTENTNDNLKH